MVIRRPVPRTPPRQTSIEAFKAIEERGLLSRRRWEAYEALFNHGPFTASEGAQHVSMRKNDLSSRLHELVAWGVAREVGTKECSITGLEVIVFDVTSGMPSRPPVRKMSVRLTEQDLKNLERAKRLLSNPVSMTFEPDVAASLEKALEVLRRKR